MLCSWGGGGDRACQDRLGPSMLFRFNHIHLCLGNGYIEWHEFLILMKSRIKDEEAVSRDMTEAFKGKFSIIDLFYCCINVVHHKLCIKLLCG